MSLIEKIARDIADALGDNFDYAFNSKPEWTAARGETKAGFRDVNQPYKSDYLDAAQAALTAIMGEGDGVQEVDRDLVWEIKRSEDTCEAWDLAARHRSTAAAAERARRDAEIMAWLRAQSDALDTSGKTGIGTLSKAVHGGGSLALHKAADAIERGEV